MLKFSVIDAFFSQKFPLLMFGRVLSKSPKHIFISKQSNARSRITKLKFLEQQKKKNAMRSLCCPYGLWRGTPHQKWSLPLKISSVNETKSAVSCGFGHTEQILNGKLHFLCSGIYLVGSKFRALWFYSIFLLRFCWMSRLNTRHF